MKKALIVGIDDYGNPALNLKGCVNDANAIAQTLETHENGSPNFDIRLKTGPPRDITRPVLRKAIEELFAGPNEMALFYFAGHGYLKSTGGYLMTADASNYNEGVSMDELLALANSSKASNKIILLDCCHAGALGSPALTGHNTAHLAEGLAVLTASRSSEPAVEVGGAGVFTALLVDALEGGAANLRGNITPGSLYAYVDEALGAWDQRPLFKANVSSFKSIREVSPKVPFEVMRKITQYFKHPKDKHDLDPSYEDTDPSANPVNVEIMKDLQKLRSAGLVIPVDAEFMYYAAMNSKSCRLTALGYQYWRLVNEKKL